MKSDIEIAQEAELLPIKEVAKSLGGGDGFVIARKLHENNYNVRDANTPYIKRIRVVSTIEYYIED